MKQPQKTCSFVLLSLIFSLSGLLSVSGAANAKSMYIDDTVYVPLRTGEGMQYRIVHKGLKSGTRVEVVTQSESGYSLVRTDDNVEGWLPSRLLSDIPIAADRLAKAEADLEKARAALAEKQASLKSLTQRDQSSSQEMTKLEQQLSSTQEELEKIRSVSQNALSLDQKNRSLLETNQQLQSEMELLRAENDRLISNDKRDYMLLGAGLILLGIFIALVVPLLKPSRKSDGWT